MIDLEEAALLHRAWTLGAARDADLARIRELLGELIVEARSRLVWAIVVRVLQQWPHGIDSEWCTVGWCLFGLEQAVALGCHRSHIEQCRDYIYREAKRAYRGELQRRKRGIRKDPYVMSRILTLLWVRRLIIEAQLEIERWAIAL